MVSFHPSLEPSERAEQIELLQAMCLTVPHWSRSVEPS